MAQIDKLVTQLRHEAGSRQVDGARFAIAQNGGRFNARRKQRPAFILGR